MVNDETEYSTPWKIVNTTANAKVAIKPCLGEKDEFRPHAET